LGRSRLLSKFLQPEAHFAVNLVAPQTKEKRQEINKTKLSKNIIKINLHRSLDQQTKRHIKTTGLNKEWREENWMLYRGKTKS